MKKLFANLICAFVPSRKLRHKIRGRISPFNPSPLSPLVESVARIEKALKDSFDMAAMSASTACKHYLSICAIAKDEGPYFAEWLEYHILAGVEKFYIYDNGSSDDTRKILEPYIKAGIVEYTYWPGIDQQKIVYNDCVEKHRFDTRWLAIIDLDEFIVPIEAGSLTGFLKSLPFNTSQILAGWAMYGSGGHKTKPKGLVMEAFKHRARTINNHVKSIINPRMCFNAQVHDSNCMGKVISDEGMEVQPCCILPRPCPAMQIRINHYHHKSLEEWLQRSVRGENSSKKDAGKKKYSKDSFERWDDEMNEVFDPIMDKYVAPVKAAIRKRTGAAQSRQRGRRQTSRVSPSR